VLEFRKEQIVKLHDIDLSSANRNQPATKPRLVKFVEEVKLPEAQSPRVPSRRSSCNENCPEITPEVVEITSPVMIEEEMVKHQEESKEVADQDCELVRSPTAKLVVVLAEASKPAAIQIEQESQEDTPRSKIDAIPQHEPHEPIEESKDDDAQSELTQESTGEVSEFRT